MHATGTVDLGIQQEVTPSVYGSCTLV